MCAALTILLIFCSKSYCFLEKYFESFKILYFPLIISESFYDPDQSKMECNNGTCSCIKAVSREIEKGWIWGLERPELVDSVDETDKYEFKCQSKWTRLYICDMYCIDSKKIHCRYSTFRANPTKTGG